MKFTDKEFKQALENLKGTYFPVRDNNRKIINLSEKPSIERIMEEIKIIQSQNQKEVNK